MRRPWIPIGLALGVVLSAPMAGCSGASYGAVAIDVSGEQAAVDGWAEIDDGWSIAIDRALVSLAGVHLRATDGDDAGLDLDPVVIDLHAGPTPAWRVEGVPARRWDDVGYRMVPAGASARAIGARAEDVERMIAGGWAFLLEGTATHPVHGERAFSIGAPIAVAATRCESADGTDGVVVRDRSTVTTEITLHLDHVFFDSFTDDASMRFTAWAAAAGDDGVVTLDDLAAQPLADLRDVDGSPLSEDGALVFYDPGSTPLARPDLASFVRHQIATIAHLDGEGHCRYALE